MKIISSRGQIKHCDVCIVQSWKHSATIISEVKQKLLKCKQQYPGAPIILVADTRLTIDPCTLKDAELAGREMFTRKMGNQLARDIGAVKYIECSTESGRCLKIVLDEIAFTYFAKLKDVEEQQERIKHDANEIRKERKKTKPFYIRKVSRCSSLYLTFRSALMSNKIKLVTEHKLRLLCSVLTNHYFVDPTIKSKLIILRIIVLRIIVLLYRPVGRAVTRSSLEREV